MMPLLNKKNILFSSLIVLLIIAGCSTLPKPRTWLIHKPVFAYPLEAQKRGLEGRVLVILHVKPNGKVDTVIVRKSSEYKILDDAAVSFASKFFYRPFKSEGNVGIWLNVPIVFKQRVVKEKSFVGKVWKSEKTRFTDKISGREITRWTTNKYNDYLLESGENPFVSKNQIIVVSDRGGTENLFLLNLIDGSLLQMTNEKEKVTNVVRTPALETLWYKSCKKIHLLNTRTLQNDVILNGDSIRVNSFTVTADGKYLLFSSAEKDKDAGKTVTRYSNIFIFNLNTEQIRRLKKFNDSEILSLIANPVDGNLILVKKKFNGVKKTEYLLLNLDGNAKALLMTDNEALRPVTAQWTYDGERLAFSAESSSGKMFLGLYNYKTGQRMIFEYGSKISEFRIFKDKTHWIVTNGDVLALLTDREGKVLNKKILFNLKGQHGSKNKIADLHFNPNGSEVYFNFRENGKLNVYSVKVNLLK